MHFQRDFQLNFLMAAASLFMLFLVNTNEIRYLLPTIFVIVIFWLQILFKLLKITEPVQIIIKSSSLCRLHVRPSLAKALFRIPFSVLVPPRIHHVSSNGRVEVKKGSTVHLECKSSGNPVPKVTWSRKNNILPGGEQSAITQVLTFDKVDRHHAGIYECTAGNGVGSDVKEQIHLHVLCKYTLIF